MKSTLVWKDGRREETRGGGMSVVKVWRMPSLEAGGGFMQTTFDLHGDPAPGEPWEYHEAETKDVSQSMREADDRIRANTWHTMELGWKVRALSGWRRRLVDWLLRGAS